MSQKSLTRFWLLPLLPLLLWLIGTIGQGLYTWTSVDYFDSLSATIPYKLLLQISLFLMCSIAALAIYHRQNVRSLSQSRNDQQAQSAKKVQDERIEMLQHLSNDEKELLKQFLGNGTRCRELSASRGPAIGLRGRRILYCPDQDHIESIMNEPMNTYCIQEWDWVHLKKHPDLLQ